MLISTVLEISRAVIFFDIYRCRIGDFLSSGIYKCYFDRYNLRPFRPYFICGLAFLVGA